MSVKCACPIRLALHSAHHSPPVRTLEHVINLKAERAFSWNKDFCFICIWCGPGRGLSKYPTHRRQSVTPRRKVAPVMCYLLNMSLEYLSCVVYLCFRGRSSERHSPHKTLFLSFFFLGAKRIKERRASTEGRLCCFYTEGWLLSACQSNLDRQLIYPTMTKTPLSDKLTLVFQPPSISVKVVF